MILIRPLILLRHIPRRKFPPLRCHTRTLSELSIALRTSLRTLPHPVVILTTAPISPLPTTATTTTAASLPGHGITLSTLTCLSLAPHPLLTFNIKTPSTTSSAMHRNGTFTVHILASTPHTAHLANVFAQLAAAGPDAKASPWAQVCGKVTTATDAGGAPELGREDGVMAKWRCVRERVVGVQDHEIWVGRVVAVEELGGEGLGLMYANRSFREVGEEVVAEFVKPGGEAEEKNERMGSVI